jgi:hypothetical protein
LKPASSPALFIWGDEKMLSLDQFLRLVSVPTVIGAFLFASQVAGGMNPLP